MILPVIFMLFAGVICFRLLIGIGVWKSRDPSRLDSGSVRVWNNIRDLGSGDTDNFHKCF